MSKTEIDTIMTYEEAAALLGVAHGTVRRWVAAGLLRPRRLLGRVVLHRTEVEALAQQRQHLIA